MDKFSLFIWIDVFKGWIEIKIEIERWYLRRRLEKIWSQKTPKYCWNLSNIKVKNMIPGEPKDSRNPFKNLFKLKNWVKGNQKIEINKYVRFWLVKENCEIKTLVNFDLNIFNIFIDNWYKNAVVIS